MYIEMYIDMYIEMYMDMYIYIPTYRNLYGYINLHFSLPGNRLSTVLFVKTNHLSHSLKNEVIIRGRMIGKSTLDIFARGESSSGSTDRVVANAKNRISYRHVYIRAYRQVCRHVYGHVYRHSYRHIYILHIFICIGMYIHKHGINKLTDTIGVAVHHFD